jgi:hypothetical protein
VQGKRRWAISSGWIPTCTPSLCSLLSPVHLDHAAVMSAIGQNEKQRAESGASEQRPLGSLSIARYKCSSDFLLVPWNASDAVCDVMRFVQSAVPRLVVLCCAAYSGSLTSLDHWHPLLPILYWLFQLRKVSWIRRSLWYVGDECGVLGCCVAKSDLHSLSKSMLTVMSMFVACSFLSVCRLQGKVVLLKWYHSRINQLAIHDTCADDEEDWLLTFSLHITLVFFSFLQAERVLRSRLHEGGGNLHWSHALSDSRCNLPVREHLHC